MNHKQVRYLLLALAIASQTVYSLNNGQAKTPAMGWNTWNKYKCDINDQIIKSNAQQLVNLGLSQLGYTYVNIDDCWQLPERDADNHTIIDRTRFEDGIKVVADYVHALGLKLGIYSSAGNFTCQNRVGSLGFEELDAADYTSWGVDYLRYDNCYSGSIPAQQRYTAMQDALNKSGNSSYYSICNAGQENAWAWGNSTANSWRTTSDIQGNWESMKDVYRQNSFHPEYSGSGAWNDPGYLQVGYGYFTQTEEKTHFALWSYAKAPLILGCDLFNLSSQTLTIIKNKNLIAINQDSLGNQARCVQGCTSDLEVYGSKNQADDGIFFGVIIVNWSDSQSLSTALDLVLIGATNSPKKWCSVFEAWTGNYFGRVQGSMLTPNIAPHDHLAVKIKCTVADDEEIESKTFL